LELEFNVPFQHKYGYITHEHASINGFTVAQRQVWGVDRSLVTVSLHIYCRL